MQAHLDQPRGQQRAWPARSPDSGRGSRPAREPSPRACRTASGPGFPACPSEGRVCRATARRLHVRTPLDPHHSLRPDRRSRHRLDGQVAVERGSARSCPGQQARRLDDLVGPPGASDRSGPTREHSRRGHQSVVVKAGPGDHGRAGRGKPVDVHRLGSIVGSAGMPRRARNAGPVHQLAPVLGRLLQGQHGPAQQGASCCPTARAEAATGRRSKSCGVFGPDLAHEVGDLLLSSRCLSSSGSSGEGTSASESAGARSGRSCRSPSSAGWAGARPCPPGP